MRIPDSIVKILHRIIVFLLIACLVGDLAAPTAANPTGRTPLRALSTTSCFLTQGLALGLTAAHSTLGPTRIGKLVSGLLPTPAIALGLVPPHLWKWISLGLFVPLVTHLLTVSSGNQPASKFVRLLLRRDLEGMRRYLIETPLENQRNAVHVFPGGDAAALFVAATVPGILSPQNPDQKGVREAAALNATRLMREGELFVLNPQNPNLLAFSRGLNGEQFLVVINLSRQKPREAGVVPFSPYWTFDNNKPYEFEDTFYPFKSPMARNRESVLPSYIYSGRMLNRQKGIYVDLDPGDTHIFRVQEYKEPPKGEPVFRFPLNSTIREVLDQLLDPSIAPASNDFVPSRMTYAVAATPWLSDPDLRKPVPYWLDHPHEDLKMAAAVALSASAPEWELLGWLYHQNHQIRKISALSLQGRPLSVTARGVLRGFVGNEWDSETHSSAVIALQPYAHDSEITRTLQEVRDKTTCLAVAFAIDIALGRPVNTNRTLKDKIERNPFFHRNNIHINLGESLSKKQIKEYLRPENDGSVFLSPYLAPMVLDDTEILDLLVWHAAQKKLEPARRALRIAAYGPQNPHAKAWEDSTRYASADTSHFSWLAFLHSPSHHEFLKWLETFELRQRLPAFAGPKRKIHNASPETVNFATVFQCFPQFRWRQFGRTIIVEENEGGATLFKRALSDQESANLQVEADLLNFLYPEERPAADLFMVVSNKNSLALNALHLRYHVKNQNAWTSSPLTWDPQNPDELAQWLRLLVKRLGDLATQGWGYTGLTEAFHDGPGGRSYNLDAQPIGVLQNIPETLVHANARAEGYLADLSPQHMEDFGSGLSLGPRAVEMARVIRDQTFQLGLIAAEVLRLRKMSQIGQPEHLVTLLRDIGDSLVKEYGAGTLNWEDHLPLSLTAVSEEILFALTYRQGSEAQVNLGGNNDVFSAPGLAAYAETMAKAIVSKLLSMTRQPSASTEPSIKREEVVLHSDVISSEPAEPVVTILYSGLRYLKRLLRFAVWIVAIWASHDAAGGANLAHRLHSRLELAAG